MSVETTTAFHEDTRQTRRILVVEPDDVMRGLLTQSLQLAGCHVVEAFDGRDALVKALAHPPTLVVTAVRLPIFDGLALCEVLRRDSMTRTVPILVLTSETGPDDLERARAAGANAILVTPAPLDTVLDEVRRLLTRPAERPGSSATPKATEADHHTQRASLSRVHSGKDEAKAHLRFDGAPSSAQPPDLICPSCDRPLVFECSHIGGLRSRRPEQWDNYVCPACGDFEYRQRTRKLRHKAVA